MKNKGLMVLGMSFLFASASVWADDGAAIQATVTKLQQQIEQVSQQMPKMIQDQSAATNATIAEQKKLTDESIAKLQADVQQASEQQQQQVQQQLDHLHSELSKLQASTDDKLKTIQGEIIALQQAQQ